MEKTDSPELETSGIKGLLKPPPFGNTRIRSAIETTLPRRRLAPPATRTALVAAIGAAVATVALIGMRLRPDIREISWLVTWGPSAFELLAGAAAVFLSMKWALPGTGVTWRRSAAFAAAAAAAVFAAAFAAPHLVHPSHPGLVADASAAGGLGCLVREFALAVPALALALVLIARSAPASVAMAGAFAGLGTGLLGDAAVHLHCSDVAAAHTVLWHLGATVVLAAAGAIIARVSARW